MLNRIPHKADSFTVIKIGNRYLAKITNKRISTAWCILGAKKYWNTSDVNYQNDCYYLIAKKRRFSVVEFAPVCEKCKQQKNVAPVYSDAELFAAETPADYPETLHPSIDDFLPY